MQMRDYMADVICQSCGINQGPGGSPYCHYCQHNGDAERHMRRFGLLDADMAWAEAEQGMQDMYIDDAVYYGIRDLAFFRGELNLERAGPDAMNGHVLRYLQHQVDQQHACYLAAIETQYQHVLRVKPGIEVTSYYCDDREPRFGSEDDWMSAHIEAWVVQANLESHVDAYEAERRREFMAHGAWDTDEIPF